MEKEEAEAVPSSGWLTKTNLISFRHETMSSFSSPTNIKLTYFPIEGPAEKVRITFALLDIPFEDVRVKFEDFQEMKPSLPAGQLPILEVDGTVYTQSFAMARYAASLDPSGRLYPRDDPKKCLQIDQMCGIFEDDARDFMAPLYMGMRPTKLGRPENFGKTVEGATVIKEMRENFVKDCLPVHYNQITNQLKSSGGPFLFGTDLTMADIWFLPRIRYLQKGVCDHVPKTCLDAYPEVLAWKDAMMAIPNIKKWYESH